MSAVAQARQWERGLSASRLSGASPIGSYWQLRHRPDLNQLPAAFQTRRKVAVGGTGNRLIPVQLELAKTVIAQTVLRRGPAEDISTARACPRSVDHLHGLVPTPRPTFGRDVCQVRTTAPTDTLVRIEHLTR